MLVCDKAGFIFIHNPKSAGTAIRAALEEMACVENRTRFWHQGWDRQEGRVLDLAHLTPGQLEDRLSGPECALPRFGFVREPMSRLASGLAEMFRRHASMARLSNTELMLKLTLPNLLHDWTMVHLCPQHRFFYSGGRLKADYIGRYESLHESWTAMCCLVGLRGSTKPQLTHARPGTPCLRTAEFMAFLSESRDSYWSVVSLYLEDYLLFGYPLPAGFNLDDSEHAQRIEIVHRPAARSLDRLAQPPEHWSPGEQAAHRNA